MNTISDDVNSKGNTKHQMSIVICTFERYRLLRRCLLHLNKLDYPAIYDVIVVDNTPDSAKRHEFAQWLQNTVPSARLLNSTPPGLSRARNVGLANTVTPIVAFLDDDAFPRNGWDKEILNAFENPLIAFAGGKVELFWETCAPDWLPDEYKSAYSALDYGDVNKIFDRHEYAVGANMAYRTQLAIKNGGFDQHLGRTGKTLLSGEETALQANLRREGYKGIYMAKAIVDHYVEKERINPKWLMSRMAYQGFSEKNEQESDALSWKMTACSQLKTPCLQQCFELLSSHKASIGERRELLLFVRTMGDMLFRNTMSKKPKKLPLELLTVTHKPNILLVEFTTHEYLCHAFCSNYAAIYCKTYFNAWSNQETLLNETEQAIDFCKQQGIDNIVFTTISPYFNLSELQLMVFEDNQINIYGILHGDVPYADKEMTNLSAISNIFNKIYVFHEECKNAYAHIDLKKPLGVIAHPPSLLSSMNHYRRKKRDIKYEKICLGFLGEIRKGKGFYKCISMLKALSPHLQKSITCIFAGAVSLQHEFDLIKNELQNSLICADFIIDYKKDDYRVISDCNFADAILRSDIIVLPYEENGRSAFSGIFTDAVIAGSGIIATNDSVMGRVITKEKVGYTFCFSDPHSLEQAIENILDDMKSGELEKCQQDFLARYFPGGVENALAHALTLKLFD